MEQKSNKGLVWLTVLLIILFIGLVSLVVFNTMLKQKEKTNNDNTTTTTTTTEVNDIEDDIQDIYKVINRNTTFVKENQYNVIKMELGANNADVFKTYQSKKPIIETKENYEVKYICNEIGAYFDEEEGCLSQSIYFNDIFIDNTDETSTCGWSDYYLLENYLIVTIVHGCFSGCYYDLHIYNLDTKEEIFNIKNCFYDDNYFKIYDNKVYYLTINKIIRYDEYENPLFVEYGYSYYDLTNKTNINVKTFEGEYTTD